MTFKGIVSKVAAMTASIAAMMFIAGSAEAAAVEGTWRTLNGAEITVAPCDAGYCGSLSYIVIPEAQAEMCRSMDKQTFAPLILDYNNADKTQQTRTLLGARMLTLKPANGPESYTATIYNAEDGKSYDVLVWILNGNTLRLSGGCLAGMCVHTEDWPRVPDRAETPDFTCDGA